MKNYIIDRENWETDPIKVIDEMIAHGVSTMDQEQFDIIMECYIANPEYFHENLRGIVSKMIQDKIDGKI